MNQLQLGFISQIRSVISQIRRRNVVYMS